jgi:hypothetical protein
MGAMNQPAMMRRFSVDGRRGMSKIDRFVMSARSGT